MKLYRSGRDDTRAPVSSEGFVADESKEITVMFPGVGVHAALHAPMIGGREPPQGRPRSTRGCPGDTLDVCPGKVL